MNAAVAAELEVMTMYEWCEGRAAWALGQPESSNPYRDDNLRFHEWAEGWLIAQRDFAAYPDRI